MATPMSISGLPALVMDPTNDALSGPKKFDSAITSADGNAVAEGVEPNNDAAGKGQTQAGSNPPGYDTAHFRENLEKGIPIESGKRSVFGFGLSTEQEDALYQYISNKSGKRPPGYEPDRNALAECWGSPEPEREDHNQSDSEEVPVVFSADLAQTLPTKDDQTPDVSESSDNSQPEATAAPEAAVAAADEEDEVDGASTESLYEGEGGVDLGARCVEVPDAVPRDDEAAELTDRELIMQKVKECYGADVKTSLGRVMTRNCKGPDVAPSAGSNKSTNLGKNKSKEDAISSMVEENNIIINLATSETNENASFSSLWEDECMRYLERAPEFRARLHYEVRVILISPAFHTAGGSVKAFAWLYEKKFGRTVESVGFSTAARLCRSMPHVVQRALLIDEGKLRLVDTPKNHRIVAGIRTGLRRIVYGIIKSHQGIEIEEIETLIEKVIMQPLNEVLTDHGYQNPSIDCLLRDMPDIVYLDEHADFTRIYLCNGAEDPALTDGILIQGPNLEECFEGMSKDKSKFNKSGSICYSKLLEGDKLQFPCDGVERPLKSPEGLRSGPNGMAPEELSDLRVLCAAESSNPYTDVSIYTTEDASPHVRLRFRLLLALHNDGRGVRLEDLPIIYEKMFATQLDLSTLGFDSFQELINEWKDVMLVKDSNDGWIFPINTLDNNRVLNTITSGLRSAVFAILLARYPEGLEPLELVECLEETLSGKLWEILRSNGYIFKNVKKTNDVLSKSPLDFQLAECTELRFLLKDMEDFVRFGCQEDGTLIIKLRDGEFPLLDLLDCEVSEDLADSKNEQSCHTINTDAIMAAEHLISSRTIEHNNNSSMTVDDQLPTITYNKGLNIEDNIGGNFQNEGLTPLITNPFKKENLALSSTSPSSSSNVQEHSPKQVCYPSQKLIHEIRMIFGSSKHMANGLTMEEFCTIYRERTGEALYLGEFKSTESLLHAMPDIVRFDLSSNPGEKMITLVQSRQNMRILSITKAGLRQVLFWVLLKNPSGIWKDLIEGWYLDFAGWPLSSALASHGYDKPRYAPLQPVNQFLEDMADLLAIDDIDSSLYVWIGLYEDPILADASLLGLPVENIQYDPKNEKNENSTWQTSIIAKAAEQFKNKEFGKTNSANTTISN